MTFSSFSSFWLVFTGALCAFSLLVFWMKFFRSKQRVEFLSDHNAGFIIAAVVHLSIGVGAVVAHDLLSRVIILGLDFGVFNLSCSTAYVILAFISPVCNVLKKKKE